MGRKRKPRGPGRTTPDLTYPERREIKALLGAGHTVAEIALFIKRSKSCVYRELARGRCTQYAVRAGGFTVRYEPDYAELEHRRAQSRKGAGLKIGKDAKTMAALERYVIEDRCSPYAAIEKARAAGELGTPITDKTFYSYIRRGFCAVEERHLLRGFRPRKRSASDEKFAERRRCDRANGGKSIEKRPKAVLSRKEFGHWEGDLVVGAQGSSAAVLTLVERKTRCLIAFKVASKRQCDVLKAFERVELAFGGRCIDVFKSITFDNGSEFLDAVGIRSSSIDLTDPGGRRFGQVYYAHPFCSGERGTNENANGMLRRVFPKGTSFDEVEEGDIHAHVEWINSYPRRILGGASAKEAFAECIGGLDAA